MRARAVSRCIQSTDWSRPDISSSPINRAGFPTVAGQRRNLHAVDESALEGWIKVAHRLFIEVDDTTRLERPDIVYLNDGALVGDFNKSVCGPVVFAKPDPTKRLAQISLDRGGPRDGIVKLARCRLHAAFIVSGSKGIIHRRRAKDRDAHVARAVTTSSGRCAYSSQLGHC